MTSKKAKPKKKVVAKKKAVKKVVTKKAVAKKVVAKKSAPKKAAKKSPPKKAATKKPAVKKALAKKPAPPKKKPVVKKALAKTVGAGGGKAFAAKAATTRVISERMFDIPAGSMLQFQAEITGTGTLFGDNRLRKDNADLESWTHEEIEGGEAGVRLSEQGIYILRSTLRFTGGSAQVTLTVRVITPAGERNLSFDLEGRNPDEISMRFTLSVI